TFQMFLNALSVFRVNSAEPKLWARRVVFGGHVKYSKDLRGDRHGPGSEIEFPVPRVRQSLRLQQIGFTAAQLLGGLFAFSRLSLFARGDVLESDQNPALGMAWKRQRTGVKNQRPFTHSREDAIHLNGPERTTARKNLFELLTQRGKFKDAI